MKKYRLLFHGYFPNLPAIICKLFLIFQKRVVNRYTRNLLNLFKGQMK